MFTRGYHIFVVMSWSYHTLSQRMTGYSAGCSSLHDDTSQPCTTKWYPPVTEMFTSVLGPWIITQKRPTYPFWIVDFNLHGFIWKCGFQNHGNQSWQSTCNKTSSCVFSAKMFGCKTIPWSVIKKNYDFTIPTTVHHCQSLHCTNYHSDRLQVQKYANVNSQHPSVIKHG